MSTPRLRRDRSIHARRFSGVYWAASNGSARRPALVATNGRSDRGAQRLADALLRAAVAVHVGGVEQGDPGVERGVEDVGGGVVVDVAPVTAELPRAQPDDADVRAGSARAVAASITPPHSHAASRTAHPTGHRVLLTGAHVLELADALGQVAVADDDDVRGTRPVGGLHRALEPPVAVDDVGGDAGLPQLPDQPDGEPLGLGAQRDDERLHAGRRADVEPLGLHRQQRPVDADGVADARHVGAAERRREPVVAATAADRRLRAEPVVHELERRLACSSPGRAPASAPRSRSRPRSVRCWRTAS